MYFCQIQAFSLLDKFYKRRGAASLALGFFVAAAYERSAASASALARLLATFKAQSFAALAAPFLIFFENILLLQLHLSLMELLGLISFR